MNLTYKTFLTLIFIGLFIFIAWPLSAKIDFETISNEKIDLDKLKIDKQQFFAFVKKNIVKKKPGLGNFGRVSFIPCQFEFNHTQLAELKTIEGKQIKFLSNPSCDQIVLRKVLSESYAYNRSSINSYKEKKCIFTLEKAFSPILEYYTILYEERFIKDCPYCESAEKSRLKKIGEIQSQIRDYCGSEQSKILKFLGELDGLAESVFKEKNQKK
ncbi:MAG: hypothetical protein OEY59_08850 [Deltaproteobacteria bacterium]|nr:hypothetical protein [Deltaproteobacteria bacterium]